MDGVLLNQELVFRVIDLTGVFCGGCLGGTVARRHKFDFVYQSFPKQARACRVLEEFDRDEVRCGAEQVELSPACRACRAPGARC